MFGFWIVTPEGIDTSVRGHREVSAERSRNYSLVSSGQSSRDMEGRASRPSDRALTTDSLLVAFLQLLIQSHSNVTPALPPTNARVAGSKQGTAYVDQGSGCHRRPFLRPLTGRRAPGLEQKHDQWPHRERGIPDRIRIRRDLGVTRPVWTSLTVSQHRTTRGRRFTSVSGEDGYQATWPTASTLPCCAHRLR